MIDRENSTFSIREQCDLPGLNRSICYYSTAGETSENLMLMRLIDGQYLKTPDYGSRRMRAWLNNRGHGVNRNRL